MPDNNEALAHWRLLRHDKIKVNSQVRVTRLTVNVVIWLGKIL
jgi:hypothetical protein